MSFETANRGFSWRCEGFSGLLYRELDQDVFVFNPLTGHTHILNPLSWQLLSACAKSPRSDNYLFELMDTPSGGTSGLELEESLQGHLQQLQQLDLLQQVEATSCS